MNVTHLIPAMTRHIRNGNAVLLSGPPGVGKTDITHAIAKNLDYDILVSHPVVSDPTDAKGFPARDGDVAKFLPFGVMAKALAATKRTIWLLDDLGQALPAVQAAYMQLLLARRLDDHVVPDCVTFVAATNLKGQHSGVSGILEPVKSRFAVHFSVDPDVEAWLYWAIENAIHPYIIAYIQQKGITTLQNFVPSKSMSNSESPRTWANVNKTLATGVLDIPEVEYPRACLEEELAGSISASVAKDFCTFMQLADKLPSIDEVLLNPKGLPISTDMSIRWFITQAVGVRANKNNFGAVADLASRWADEGNGEMGAFLVRLAAKTQGDVKKHKRFKELLTDKVFGNLLK